MKVHYKSVLLCPKSETEDELWSRQIIEVKRKYKIEYCCEHLKAVFDDNFIALTQHELFLQRESNDHDGRTSYYYHRVDFCPFCGERVKYIEDYKAELKNYTVTNPAKKTPAKRELKKREVRIG